MEEREREHQRGERCAGPSCAGRGGECVRRGCAACRWAGGVCGDSTCSGTRCGETRFTRVGGTCDQCVTAICGTDFSESGAAAGVHGDHEIAEGSVEGG